jgi:hypothetical protein
MQPLSGCCIVMALFYRAIKPSPSAENIKLLCSKRRIKITSFFQST